ncbi:pentatricopeptide repeat-containing protein At4g19191, mitochondrial isoform X2 [Pistacia vera]|uniref:pentatricopeptide repeat-containing protein At4g19191, mitochondrial isoform X2 n=1 Tax=Pistacia vera TaxID=55513 RepID=UPI0012636B69|nr:pentatricopeptide repeat-containing protein At4g19191, mitochondrial isoform X2 [Pistacia vera]
MVTSSLPLRLNRFSKFSPSNQWNFQIREAVSKHNPNQALLLFRQMKQNDIVPNNFIFIFIAKACAQLSNLKYSQMIHTHTVKSPFGSHIYVQTTMVDMYVKCDQLDYACSLFDEMTERDVASWNAMLVGFAQKGFVNEVLRIFYEMRFAGIKGDAVTAMGLTQSVLEAKNLNLLKAVHSIGIQMGMDADIEVATTWISAYAKCSDLNFAELVFYGIEQGLQTVVSWNSMIAGYANNGKVFDAVRFYKWMMLDGFRPDVSTIVSLLSACAQLEALLHGCGQGGTLELGKWIDNYASSKGLRDNVMVCNALIDMYAKCGSIPDARELFLAMPERTVVSWTAMIAGCALNGEFSEALDLFHQMVELGLWPNHVTFLAVLRACAHAGFLEKGWECFNMMTEVYNINPGLDHYSCMADILGRRGKLKKALDFVQSMPIKPDAGIWGALLSACKIHHNIEIGEYVAHRLFELVPHVAAPYVEMANIYAFWGRWDGVAKIRSMMKCNNVNKFPGQSQVHVNGKTCTFTVEDRDHPEGIVIYALLDCLTFQLKEKAYLPQFEEISQHE